VLLQEYSAHLDRGSGSIEHRRSIEPGECVIVLGSCRGSATKAVRQFYKRALNARCLSGALMVTQ